jgi:hypothetical protein
MCRDWKKFQLSWLSRNGKYIWISIYMYCALIFIYVFYILIWTYIHRMWDRLKIILVDLLIQVIKYEYQYINATYILYINIYMHYVLYIYIYIDVGGGTKWMFLLNRLRSRMHELNIWQRNKYLVYYCIYVYIYICIHLNLHIHIYTYVYITYLFKYT